MWQLFVSNNFFLKKYLKVIFLLLATYHLLGNKFLISSLFYTVYSHHYPHPPREETKLKMYLHYNVWVDNCNYYCIWTSAGIPSRNWVTEKSSSGWVVTKTRCQDVNVRADHSHNISYNISLHIPSPSHPANQLSIQCLSLTL